MTLVLLFYAIGVISALNIGFQIGRYFYNKEIK